MSLPRHQGPSFRRYSRGVLICLGWLIVSFAAINTWVNPLWVTKAPWTNEAFAEFRPIYRHQRTAKAGMVTSTPWDTAFFGSSRVDIALDPEHPGWGERKAINLAVSAGALAETERIFHYAVTHAPIDLAIIGVDVSDMVREFQGFADVGFTESRFYELGDPVERELRYLFGVSSFESSVQTLINQANRELPEYTPRGHRSRPQEPVNVAEVIARHAIGHAVRTTRVRRHFLEISPDKTRMLQNILQDGKKHGCRIVILIPPSHATYIGTLHYLGDPDAAFGLDREALTRLVRESNEAHPDAPPAEIWDFNDFHPLNCEPVPPVGGQMHWWLDGTHARKTLGDVMLERIMGWPVEEEGRDYGIQLTAENLEQRIASIKEGYDRFKSENPRLWKWMVEGIERFESAPSEHDP